LIDRITTSAPSNRRPVCVDASRPLPDIKPCRELNDFIDDREKGARMSEPRPPKKTPPSNGLTIFVVLGLPIVLTFLAMLWLLSLMMWGR